MEASSNERGRQLSLLFLFSILNLVWTDDCKFGKYDLSNLHMFSPWSVRNDYLNATFEISLCGTLKQDSSHANCPDGTSVCAHFDDGKAISFGSFSSDHQIDDSTKGENAELILMMKGDNCPQEGLDSYTTIFYFKCGKTLGLPRHLGDFPCITHFEWESYIFCQDMHTPDKEVPCAVINKESGHMIDLSPLTKLTGAYLVDADETHKSKFYINVCREISSGTSSTDPLKDCPKGAGSCQILENEVKSFGTPDKKLESTADGAKLVYTAKEKPDRCLTTPSTTINFRCPERGGSKDPVLLTDFILTCSIEIDWVTEYACPVHSIVSNTCQLTMVQHNVDIDLSPLKRSRSHPYVVNVTDGNDHYSYFINVCDALGIICGKATPAQTNVCQIKPATGDSWSAGDKSFTTLRYSDNQLTMEMKHGDPCHTNFRRVTTIDFICNKSAVNDGHGYPKFVSHESCSYFFVWETKYACVEATVSEVCAVEVDNKKYDLSALVREEGDNWEVITGENENDGKTYFLNVCHDILKTDQTSGCPQGAAVCAIGKDGASSSLGSYQTALSFDKASGSLRLLYENGAKTDYGCVSKTKVNFFCSPGNLDSAPRLVHRTENGCYHEIEWHTSAACVLSHKTGTDCKVYDDALGYTFDLNPLKKDEGYTIDGSDDYQYLINICAAVNHNTYCQSSPHDNAAICQINVKGNKEQVKVASPSTKLEYFDGVLNLTYTDGEPYRDVNHTPRQAQIAFLCDLAVNVGSPKFLEEKEFTYAFEWRTRYACPTLPVECAFTDEATHKQYDLSSLVKTTMNWEVANSPDSNNNIKKFYINICHPVVPVEDSGFACSQFASVCATNIDENGKETLFHGNLGGLESAPELEASITGLKLTYTNGDTCDDTDGTTKNFKTSIHFVCVPGKVTGGPNSPRLINPCEYAILWETEAACAIDSVTNLNINSTDCSVKDPNSDFVFNLKPLAINKGYDVKAGTKSYKLNICGTLPEAACGKFGNKSPSSVCEVAADKTNSSKASMEHSSLEYTSQGEMTLTYQGKRNVVSGALENYILNFFCDRKAQSPNITIDSESGMSVTFKVLTALACAPQPVSCIAIGENGTKFDLSDLAREDGNWEVIDSRGTHADLHYYINVCRPVNPSTAVTCPGGAVGGCQISTAVNANYNMGYVQSEPVLASDEKAITLRYQGGDKCHVGKKTEAFRSTRIIFFCDTVEHGPIFDSESDTCEYVFFWKTPSACPQQDVTGEDCKVTDPVYNFEFDLSPLKKMSGHYSVPGAGYTFLLNVCGNLNGAPELCADANTGACQTAGGLNSPVVTGKFSDRPQYKSGVITLNYKGGKDNCHGKYERSTVIDFVCHHNESGEAGPRYMDEKDDCTYTFEWPTKAACPPHQVTDCVLQAGDKTFDLSRLSKADGNYEVAYNSSNEKFILNVCRSLVHKKGQTCPSYAAACRIDLSETDPKKRYHSLGEVSSHSLSYNQDSEVLILKYDNGETCADTKKRKSTVILFKCDDKSDALGTPGGHFVLNDCEEHFVWTSSAACPLVKTEDTTEHEKGFGNCKVTNPNTGYEFDLSSLKKLEGYATTDRNGHDFYLNVCGWLDSSSKCTNGTGSCKKSMTGKKESVNAGKANAHLSYDNGVLSLKYRDGEICSKNQVPRMTYINFVCQPGAGNGVPVFIDSSDDCLYYFDWHTQLACEKEVPCSVDTPTGYSLDFSPLIKKTGKYNVIPSRAGGHQPTGIIYVNLCRPLNPIFGTLCPSGSGACLVNNDGKPLSLGRIDGSPVYDTVHKQTRLTYTRGDPCPSNPQLNITSVIILTCGANEYSEPTEEGMAVDCQYVFLWETTLACEGKREQKLFPNCTFFDYSIQKAFDLSTLSDLQEIKSSHGGKYQLQLCGGIKEKGETGQSSCAGSAVCMKDSNAKNGSYGDSSHGLFQKGSSYIQLTFSQGRQCGKVRAMSTIYFYCDRSAGNGMPEIVYEGNECEVTFRWETDLVCPPQKEECLIGNKGTLFDLSLLSQDTGSWNYTDKEKNVYWLNLCQSVHGNAISSKCRPEAAICMRSSDGNVKMLGRLDSQQISTVGEKPLNTTVIVQYSEGEPDVCSSNRRRRRDISPKVIIKLSCGSTVGVPVLQPTSNDKCVFNFIWKSKLACPVGFNNQPLEVKNGIIHDYRTGKQVDLGPILSRRTNIEIPVENKKYVINIGREVLLDRSNQQTSHCDGASVCLVIPASNSYQNIGSFSTGSFYME
ncbi:cation-independent mannose-6-phosphate receptor-like protein, partial [Plakobranchus ocellatus]